MFTFGVLAIFFEKSHPLKVAKAILYMLESEESVQKLKGYLKNKGFKLSDSEIDKIVQNLYELGLFLVRLKIKQHSQSTKPVNFKTSENTETNPP